MRVFFSLLASALVLYPSVSPVVFADPYQDLQSGTHVFGNVLQQDQQQQAEDQADLTLEASEEFFPDSASGSVRKPEGALTGNVKFVTFTLNGVPYVLKDVPISAWFAPYVRDVADRGVVSGYRNKQGVPTGVFGPERAVSIEELAKMAIEAAHFDRTLCSDPPKNPLAAVSWSSSYIACAEQRGFSIYSDGTVDIARPATRAEVVMTVLQAFGVSLREMPEKSPLKDVTQSTLFSSAISTALEGGVVSGFTDAAGNPTGYFGPEKPVNRAEVSKIISLSIQIYGGD